MGFDEVIFNKTKPADKQFQSIPNGIYLFKILSEEKMYKSNNDNYVKKLLLVVATGEYQGFQIPFIMTFSENDKVIAVQKRRLLDMGVPNKIVSEFSELKKYMFKGLQFYAKTKTTFSKINKIGITKISFVIKPYKGE